MVSDDLHADVVSELSNWCIRHSHFFGDYEIVKKILKEKGYHLVKTVKSCDYLSPRRMKGYKEICSIEQYFGGLQNFQNALVITRLPNSRNKSNKEYWIKGE